MDFLPLQAETPWDVLRTGLPKGELPTWNLAWYLSDFTLRGVAGGCLSPGTGCELCPQMPFLTSL